VPAEDIAEEPVVGEDAAEVPAEDVAEEPVVGEDAAAEVPVKEAVQKKVWDNLVGYYQQVVTAYNSLFSSLKK